MKLKKYLDSAIFTFRIKDWLLSKLLFNISILYFVFCITNPDFSIILKTVILLCTYIISIGALGYFINNWFDSNTDAIVSKNYRMANISTEKKITITLSLFLLGSIPFYFALPKFSDYVILLTIQIVLIFLYSIPKIRLKKNIFGILADAIYSYVIPGIISIIISTSLCGDIVVGNKTELIWLSWMLLIGIRSILMHQYKDFQNDIISHVKTFTIQIGLQKSLIIIKTIIIFELILLVVLITILKSSFGIAFLFALLSFFIIEGIIDNKKFKLNDIFQFIINLNTYYDFYLFIGFAILLSINLYTQFLIIVILFVGFKLWNKLYYIIKTFYFKVLKHIFYKILGAYNRVKILIYKNHH